MSSLNNLNARNLFEMKNPNRYAQLVETKTPEPQESAELDQKGKEISDVSRESSLLGAKDTTSSNEDSTELVKDSPIKHSSLSCLRQKSIEDDEDYDQVNNSNSHRFVNSCRKNSQSSSQLSNSLISTSCCSQTPAGPSSMTNQFQIQVSSEQDDTAIRKNGYSLTKTISQSISKLDQATRMNNYQVSWKNITFSYEQTFFNCLKKKSSHVLKDISGSFRSNQLIAVIGPSGCGKTTLLQFLAGNNSECKDRLRITGLDEPKVAFIGQDDGLLPGLTAKETLIYASKLQNTRRDFDHEKHIQPIIKGLGLNECADRSVTKLSGGQAKRVTIAQELLYPTNLLILDEVTSGLDASTSYSIIELLKQLVSDREYPMSIVISIHQPSARLFAVFDQVYVMSDGYCLYEGSCKVDTINRYLNHFGLECPPFHNIADYLIEIASESDYNVTNENSIRERLIKYQQKQGFMTFDEKSINHVYEKDGEESKYSTNENETQQVLMVNDSVSLYDAIEKGRSKRERPILNHLLVHLARSMLRIRRSYILTYLQLITYILLGLQLSTFYGTDIGTLGGCPQLPMSLLTFIFSHENEDNVNLEMRRIQENMNFLLVAIMTATFAALEITVITFPLEAKTVKREWRNGWYRVSSYFMGRTLADLPFQLTFVIVFCVIIYTLTGQIGLTSWRFASFVLIMVMTALIAQTVGFIFGALFMDNLPAAVFTAPLCIFPALLFSGFFSRVSQIPSFYKPMTYLSHFRYAFDALLVTLYGYNRCECDQETLTAYHVSLQNQTGTVRDIFKSLFGSVDCGAKVNPEENSIEDTLTSIPELDTLYNHTTTPIPILSSTTTALHVKTLEDVLVDTVFEHMKNSTNESLSGSFEGGPSNIMVQRFSTKITTMLNSRSNFGYQIPTRCENFNAYLMTEFDLHNDDLIFGLAMLFIVVVLSRLICNGILTFTIATRSTSIKN